jgi:hypothetical protein
LVHIGNTYQFWIGKHGLNLTINFTPYNQSTPSQKLIVYSLALIRLLKSL